MAAVMIKVPANTRVPSFLFIFFPPFLFIPLSCKGDARMEENFNALKLHNKTPKLESRPKGCPAIFAFPSAKIALL
jgi:hypothetical protein